MKSVSKRTLAIVALSCACVVLLAGTAHVLFSVTHISRSHKHSKAVPDVVSSLAVFSLAAEGLFSQVVPALSIVAIGRLNLEIKAVRDHDILRPLIGRAPPVFA